MILKRIKVQMKFVGETNCYIVIDEKKERSNSNRSSWQCTKNSRNFRKFGRKIKIHIFNALPCRPY